ncbi:hypothetical protein CCMA1212_008254 [Trichoderma ghanense]|uniref:Uncharacterized protein n=1 Tax=Trichoderma ghanense TaxID=65468 RepID=A0ABY2GXT0_9HYPO
MCTEDPTSRAIQRLRRCTQPYQDNDHVKGSSHAVSNCIVWLRRCLRPCQINDHAGDNADASRTTTSWRYSKAVRCPRPCQVNGYAIESTETQNLDPHQ